jgi:hypothetical protein
VKAKVAGNEPDIVSIDAFVETGIRNDIKRRIIRCPCGDF